MRYLLIVLFLSTSVFADSFVVSGGNQSLIRSGKSAVLAPTNQVPAVVQVPRHVKPPARSTVDPDYYVVFFSGSSCIPCQAFKLSPEYAQLKQRFLVRLVNTDNEPQWNSLITRLPTFWLVKRSNRVRVAGPWEGVQSLAIFQQAARDLRAPRAVRKSQSSPGEILTPSGWQGLTLPSKRSMSHGEMVELHNRLHGGGQWTWPGDLRTHLRTVHGQNL